MRKFIGSLIILICAAIIGYGAYILVPKAIMVSVPTLKTGGPLIIVFIFVMAGVEALIAYILFLITRTVSPFGSELTKLDKALVVLCALAGIPVTVSLCILFWQGKIGSFSGMMLILFNGVFLIAAIFTAVISGLEKATKGKVCNGRWNHDFKQTGTIPHPYLPNQAENHYQCKRCGTMKFE